MIYGKIDRYILIAILVVVAVCLYFLFTNKKDTNNQSDLLIAMAQKLRVTEPAETVQEVKKETKPAPPQKTEADEAQIIAIADKLCFGKKLSDDEWQFRRKFSVEIQKEVESSKQLLNIILNKFLTGVTEFDEYEKEYYEAYQEDIDKIINDHKSKAEAGEETPLFPLPSSIPPNGANPPMAAGERLKIILSLFEDGVPKTVTDLAAMYAEKTNTKVSKGNISTMFGKLVDNHQLIAIKAKNGSKVYHCLPEWFDGRKLKPEYKEKIQNG